MAQQPERAGGATTLPPSLLVGVPAIDEQHRRLIDDLNRLLEQPHSQPSSELFSDVLSRLGRELSEHFEFEERYFRRMGLPTPEIEAHLAAHAEIIHQYTELNLELMHNQAVKRTDVLSLIRRWVVDHIVVHDLRLRLQPEGGPAAG